MEGRVKALIFSYSVLLHDGKYYLQTRDHRGVVLESEPLDEIYDCYVLMSAEVSTMAAAQAVLVEEKRPGYVRPDVLSDCRKLVISISDLLP
jgi:hypothetical protein